MKTNLLKLATLCLAILLATRCGTLDTALVKLKADTDILRAKTNNAALDVEEGARNLRDAVDVTNLNARADLEYGERQYHIQNYEIAKYYFDRTLLTLPDNFTALKLAGWARFFQGQYDEALPAFLRAHARYPDKPDPVVGVAWSYFGVKNYEKALEHFDKAERLSGDSYQIHKGRGLSYLKLQDHDKAKQEFAKIFSPAEIDRLMADWREWKAGESGSLINAVADSAESPALITLPVESPRYHGGILAHQSAEPSAEIDRAWKLSDRGLYPKAIKQFKKQDTSRSLDAANGLAWSYLRHGQIIKAEKLFRRINKIYTGFKGAVEGLAEVEKTKKEKSRFADYYRDLKKHKVAILEFEELATRYPGWVYPYANMGDIHLTLKNHEYAQAFYRKALDLDPENRAAQKGLDLVYQKTAPQLSQANRERGKEHFKTASWLYADYIEKQDKLLFRPANLAEAYNGLGWSYFGKKQYKLAIKKFNKARGTKKFASEAAKGLGLSYYNLENYQKAAEFLAIANKQQPDKNEIAYKLDWSILKNSSLDRAEEHFKNVLRKSPLRASSYMGLGWVNYQRKKPDLAVEYFLKAISLDPDFAWTPEFREVLDKERFGWQVYNRFAWTYYHKKQYPKAVDIFAISRTKASGKSDTLKGIGYTLFKQEKYKEAVVWLNRSLSINPDPLPIIEMVSGENAISPFAIETSIRTKMGWSFFYSENYDQAVSLFTQELEKHPAWSDVNNGLGWSYLKMNRLAEARAAFNLALKSRPLNHLAHKGLNQVKRIFAVRKLQQQSQASRTSALQSRKHAEKTFLKQKRP